MRTLLSNGNTPPALRNRIVHGYWSIDLDILVTTGQDDIPRFLAEITELMLDEY